MKGKPCPYKSITCQEAAGCHGCQILIDYESMQANERKKIMNRQDKVEMVMDVLQELSPLGDNGEIDLSQYISTSDINLVFDKLEWSGLAEQSKNG
uniref:Uncharacterized protein n=1 Tax=viral metagenome TaxID=1070528 RepID=A0A6M3KM81_9ZZZZ